MNQQDFEKGIKHQQSLIRKLLSNRQRRSECIDQLVSERYQHLVGKFVQFNGDETYYCISGFKGDISSLDDDHVEIVMELRYIEPRRPNFRNEKGELSVLCIERVNHRYAPQDDLDALLADRFVVPERVTQEMYRLTYELMKNFGLRLPKPQED